MGAGREHDVVRMEALVFSRDQIAGSVASDAMNPDAGADVEAEAQGVGFQIVGELVLGVERPERAGVGRSRKLAEHRRCEEAERIPLLSPVVADVPVGFQDQEGPASPPEVVAGREAGLPAADNDRFHTFGSHCRLPPVFGPDGASDAW